MDNIAVFLNGSNDVGKVIKRPGSLLDLLQTTAQLFRQSILHAFTINGTELNNETWGSLDVFVVSTNIHFAIPPVNDSTEQNEQEVDGWVRLNVGGTYFTTTQSTLVKEADSMLAKMFDSKLDMKPGSVDKTGAYLIDRDPALFKIVLNYLRTGKFVVRKDVSYEAVLAEASYFGLSSLVTSLNASFLDEKPRSVDRNVVRNAFNIPLNKRANLEYLKYINFTGCNLMSFNMSGINFRGACFKRCNMIETDLSDCNLEGANFQEAQLNYCKMNNSKLARTNLQRTNFFGASLRDCDMSHATITGANFGHALLMVCHLSGAFLNNSCLENCFMKECYVDEAVLDGASLKFCILYDTSFMYTSFKNADLQETLLMNCDLRETDFTSADLRGCKWEEEDAVLLERSNELVRSTPNYTGCNFQDADFTGANLKGLNLQYCQLMNADLSGANLHNSNLLDCFLKVSGAESKPSLIENRCLMEGAVLRNANLQDCDLSNCVLGGAIFTGANLEGIIIEEEKLEILVQMM